MTIKLKPLTAEEQAAIKKLSRSCTAPAVEVESARIILLASEGARVPAIARKLELTETNVRVCLKRFDDEGLARMQDRPRSGRPFTYQSG